MSAQITHDGQRSNFINSDNDVECINHAVLRQHRVPYVSALLDTHMVYCDVIFIGPCQKVFVGFFDGEPYDGPEVEGGEEGKVDFGRLARAVEVLFYHAKVDRADQLALHRRLHSGDPSEQRPGCCDVRYSEKSYHFQAGKWRKMYLLKYLCKYVQVWVTVQAVSSSRLGLAFQLS
jgi:hypothetical protein